MSEAGVEVLAGQPQMNGITCNADGSIRITVGNNAEIWTETGGGGWVQQTAAPPFTDDFAKITYDGATFVAVGENAEIQTSVDGVGWVQRTPGAGFAGDFTDIEWRNGLFVVSGETGEVQTSPDGITWTRRTIPGAGNLAAIAKSDDTIIATTTTESYKSIDDGLSWTGPFMLVDNGFLSQPLFQSGVAFDGTQWIHAGASTASGEGFIQVSADGENWKRVGPQTGGFEGHYGVYAETGPARLVVGGTRGGPDNNNVVIFFSSIPG